MQFSLPNQVIQAINLLNASGYQAYVVGGCIRNFLLRKESSDYDLTTSATPVEMLAVFKDYQCIETGIKHGTITVVINKMPLEITTFRIESSYLDHRRPTSVIFTTQLEEDLKRRDFTMNALAYHPAKGLIDLFNGRNDIYGHLIKCIGDPQTRFNEDALRIMRALRFSATLSFKIEEATQIALRECKEYLNDVSAERLSDELLALLCGENCGSIIRNYYDVLAVIIPELNAMHNFEQNSPYHIYDVLEHTIATIEAIPNNPLLRLTMLLHDSGKPSTYSEKDGIGHFFQHTEKSLEIANSLCERLRLPNKFKADLLTLIKYHDSNITAAKKDIKLLLMEIGSECFELLLQVKRADNAGKNPVYNASADYDLMEETYHEIINNQECFNVAGLVINGSDLQKLGFEGKEIGIMLERLVLAIINEESENTTESLYEYALLNK